MRAKFFCKTGLMAGKEFFITEKASIGRHRRNSIIIPHKSVSNFHAGIYYDHEAKTFILKNLSSQNGVEIDGVRVDEIKRLEGVHVITIARSFDFFFQTVGVNNERGGQSSKPPKGGVETVPLRPAAPSWEGEMKSQVSALESQSAANPNGHSRRHGNLPAVQPEAPTYKTTVVENPAQPPLKKPKADNGGKKQSLLKTVLQSGVFRLPGSRSSLSKNRPSTTAQPQTTDYFIELQLRLYRKKRFYLKTGENIIGRSKRCDIYIQNASLSKKHASILVTPEGLVLRDLGSTNNTYLQGGKVSEETRVKSGASIRFGWVETKLRSTH